MIIQKCLSCGEDTEVKDLIRDMYNPEGFCVECRHCGATFDIDWNYFKKKMFIDDVAKMDDFKELNKKEFLESYSYLTEEEYDITKLYFEWLKRKGE